MKKEDWVILPNPLFLSFDMTEELHIMRHHSKIFGKTCCVLEKSCKFAWKLCYASYTLLVFWQPY